MGRAPAEPITFKNLSLSVSLKQWFKNGDCDVQKREGRNQVRREESEEHSDGSRVTET